MSTTALQLPIDVPWKRLCVSDDMIDRQVCDRKFPLRWRSSLAVFGYQPPEDYQTYEGMTVSYLKVVATITGYQPDAAEVGIKDRRISSYWNDPVVIQNYLDVVNHYYGCYGAIVEVAIAPTGAIGRRIAAFDPDTYPYFADFEPKRRELYEVVSETGEVMSRSLENVNVRKGVTTTDSHEVLDVFKGMSAQASYAGTGGGFSVSGEWGTKDMSQQEYTNVRTVDQAREMRETYSHTTQLTQMYHQLDSYHLGTNRAVFFLVPRPHIVQSELTFVNGPRVLEGIQELFLVVMRPKDMVDFCIEAYLETAHIAAVPILKYATSTGVLTLHTAKHAEDTSGSFGDDSNTTYAETSEVYTPPDGWEVDTDRDGGYHIDSASGDRIETATVTEVARDHVTAYGKVSAWFEDRTWPESNLSHDGSLDMVVTVYIRKIKPDIDGYTQDLYLTGRGLCCGCAAPPLLFKESLVYETAMSLANVHAVVGREEKMSVADANAVRAFVARTLPHSRNDPERYPIGTLTFTEGKTVARSLAGVIRDRSHPDNHVLNEIVGLPEDVRRKVERVAPKVSRGRLLGMPLQEQIDRFGLTEDEAVALRRAAVGLAGPVPEPTQRWDQGGAAGAAVADLTGMTVERAETVLNSLRFKVGTVTTADSPRSAGTILGQYPRPGGRVGHGRRVDVVVASGAIVTLPDVVGERLPAATAALRRAGLTSEPIIVTTDEGENRDVVVAMTPVAGTSVTPGASVVLERSGGQQTPKARARG